MNGGWFLPSLSVASSAVLGLALAASYGAMEASSSSAFCGSCHVMRAYHSSWSESTHRDVSCVACHIPPGLGAGIKKKLDGLSMLARTLAGEYSEHINAQVEDEVCLQCHERRLLVGQEWFGTVLFDHRPHLTKLRRGVQLNCSSCHSQIVQGDHITVTSSSCLVCHFLNREADAAESECSLCHQVDGMVAERGGLRFDHARAVDLGVDCESCHEPLPLEASTVPRERCLSCHNRPDRLVKLEDTQFLIESHVNNSRALCGDCHQDVRHVGARRDATDPPRCNGCHLDRVNPQLVLYADLAEGSVGPTVSPMFLAGVRCQACHSERTSMITKPADSITCLKCHPLGIERLFGWWRETVNERQVIARRLLDSSTAEIGRVDAALGDATRAIELVERGRGVHNLQLSMELLDSAVARMGEARFQAGLAPLAPPWPETVVDSSCFRCHQGTEPRSMSSFGRDFRHPRHVLEGKLGCEKCHESHERGDARLLFEASGCQGCHHEQIDLETCGSCHEDLHRAQFARARCDQCHVAEFWTPAPGFDHDKVAYPLTGKHLDVPCADCHLEGRSGGVLLVRYRGLSFERCEDCHLDPHAVRLGPNCESCHVTESWSRMVQAEFDHEVTRYPLRGGHVGVECRECHPAGQPSRIERYEQCSTCHEDEHLGQFAALEEGPECEPCHSVTSFLPTLYSPDHHQATAFPLRGAHLAVPCNSCHEEIPSAEITGLVRTASLVGAWATVTAGVSPASTETEVQFRFAATGCIHCHQDPHSGATDRFMVERGCEACHVEDEWSQVDFDHRLESFPLEGKHLRVPCIDCHPRQPENGAQCVQLRGVPVTCNGCHDNPHLAVTGAGTRTSDCERCHTAESWSTTPFDHRRDTRFPLLAAHAETSCGGCHPDSRYEQTSSQCRDCHVDPHRGELGMACDRCHTPDSWTHNVEALTTHSATLFPLDGAHATLDCQGCHDQAAPFEFSSTPTDCHRCHEQEYLSSASPDHEQLALSTECASCHDTRSWAGATFQDSVVIDHDPLFELTGAHRGLDCSQCHRQGYAGTARDCAGCHREDFDRTTEPNHSLAAFPSDCALCHTTERWLGASFTHGASYALKGAHRGLDCQDCHSAGFANASNDCLACHRDELASAEPDHQAAGFGNECSDCHNQRDWARADFDHAAYWRLTGGHRQLDCLACHAKGYAGTSSDCYACHRRDYRRVTDPDHRAAGFGTACDDCHGTRTWSGASLDHNTVFYLTGAHRNLGCEECHASGYSGTPRDCYGCHADDYVAVRDPGHPASGFSTDCTECHGTASWRDVDIDHGAAFPLTGAHQALDCLACHDAGYQGTSPDCGSCHREDFDRTRSPNHRTAGFSTDCQECHSTEGWSNAAFEHDPGYPLTGGHRYADCQACHAQTYAGTPRDCVACHRTDYDRTRQPNHRGAGMPEDCTLCHTTDAWPDTHFEHDGHFQLTGAHTHAACSACHARGYAGTPRDCETCHLDDYNASVDPDHAVAGFPRACVLCHDTHRWQGGSFDHDSFWALTGIHASINCTRCHDDRFAGTPRDCAGCHLDDYLETVNPYHEAAQFSHACESCHSTNRWYGARFLEHDSRHFPIYSGSHEGRWGSCRTCHRVNRDYQFYSCTVCHTHRRDRMDRFHSLVDGYEFEDSACYACHPTGRV